MNYTVDNHTKREKVRDSKGNIVTEKNENGLTRAKVEITEGFIVRAEDRVVGFVKTKKEAMALIAKEKANPTVIQASGKLSIERHSKKIRKEDGLVQRVHGFNLRAGDKVVKFSESKSDLVKLANKMKSQGHDEGEEKAIERRHDTGSEGSNGRGRSKKKTHDQ